MYYKLDENKNVIPGTMEDAEDIFENSDKKIVKQENVGDKFVSTVFLPLDHGYPRWSGHTENYKPVVFETMIYDETKDEWLDYQDRYHTWKEAEEGHQKAVQWVMMDVKRKYNDFMDISIYFFFDIKLFFKMGFLSIHGYSLFVCNLFKYVQEKR